MKVSNSAKVEIVGKDSGLDPQMGFYTSNIILKADWASDIKQIESQMSQLECHPHYQNHLDDRNTDDIFRILALRSHDGLSSTFTAFPEVDENPADYKWTDIYHNSPNLKKLVDWFQVEKARVRLFRQIAGASLPIHRDFDNERNGHDPENITVRIIVQLSDTNNWWRLVNDTTDITIQLQPGQFVILNTDVTWHSTVNNDTRSRDTLNIVCKWNDWLADLVKPERELTISQVEL